MAKFLKITLVIILSFLVLIGSLIATYFIITKDARLDESKLINPNQTVIICDDDGNEITNASVSGKKKSVKIEELNQNCIDAFIASEDRTFYTHKGLNYKRMLKALYTNIASRSFKEGASTISQQLIKNTHLSQDKTIKRKLNEIRLTKQLERKYSKNEILEMYLNTIYFGHNCYGLQSAAEFYFDKKAENLELTESATLVGLLTSPNNYSPFKNPEKSLQKRNTVLKSMLECNFITENEYNDAIKQPLNAKEGNKNDRYSSYINAVFDELEELELNAYDLSDGCTIETYLNTSLQEFIENYEHSCDNSAIITTKDGGVSAFKSTIGSAKRQPGSTVKPLFVYAPAIDEKILSPFTKILDEKIDFGGYSPENFDKKYHGYVTVTESIKNSYNIPAVKTLNALNIKTAEKYITRMNISLDDDEKNLSLALGGMKYGLSLKEICDRYSIFQNMGVYSPSDFIKEITTKDGQTLYKRQLSESRAFSEGACSLINDTLIETAKTGTAKKLKSLNYNIAAKTGTCGNTEGNTDAYAIGYTSQHTVGVWLGDASNQRLDITGGGDACGVLKNILEKLYGGNSPAPLDTNSGTTTVEIDAEDYYSDNKIVLADRVCPKLNKLKVKVISGNEPKQTSTKFSSPTIKNPSITVNKGTVNIELCQTKYYAYLLKRYQNGKYEVIYDGKWKNLIEDTPNEGYYTYSVIPYYQDGENKIYGREISLPPVSVNNSSSSPQVKIPDIVDKEWYNL